MNNILNRAIFIFLFLLLSVGGTARAGFSNVYVVGDSLSDTGNLAALPGFEFLLEYPYDAGFSNGPRAVEALAGYLGLSLAETDTDAAMAPLQSAACTYRIAFGPRIKGDRPRFLNEHNSGPLNAPLAPLDPPASVPGSWS